MDRNNILRYPIFWIAGVVITGFVFALGVYFGVVDFTNDKSDFNNPNTSNKSEIMDPKQRTEKKDTLSI